MTWATMDIRRDVRPVMVGSPEESAGTCKPSSREKEH